jgi:hypothetical protein
MIRRILPRCWHPLPITAAWLFLCAPSAATAQVCPRWQGFPQADASPGGAHRLSITGGTRGARDVRLFDANDSLVLAVSAHVTNALWAGDGEHLVATVSPSGGAPGIYRYDLSSGRIRRIVWPDEWTDWYPDGANWFVLCRVEGDTLFYMSLRGPKSRSDRSFHSGLRSTPSCWRARTSPVRPIRWKWWCSAGFFSSAHGSWASAGSTCCATAA